MADFRPDHRLSAEPEIDSGRKRSSRKLACHLKPNQLKLALMLGAPPMNPFFYSEEAGAKGLLECTPKVRQAIKGPATLNGGEQCWCPDKSIPVN